VLTVSENELLTRTGPCTAMGELFRSVLEHAPDLTIEILSRHETRRSRTEKIDDYHQIGVKECWIVSPQAHTVEVLRLSPEEMYTLQIYGVGMRVHSEMLEGLDLPVDDVFVMPEETLDLI